MPNIQGFISSNAVIWEKQDSLLVWERHELYLYDEDQNSWVDADAPLLGDNTDDTNDDMDDSDDDSRHPYIYPRLIMTYGNYNYALGR